MATGNPRTVLHELSRYFERRLDQVGDEAEVGIDELAIRPLLRAWAELISWAEKADLTQNEARTVADAASEAKSGVEMFGRTVGHAQAGALASVRGNLDAFPPIFSDLLRQGASDEIIRSMLDLIDKASEEAERSIAVMTYVTQRTSQLDQAVKEARDAADAADKALALAEKAATKTATGALETSFKTTAKSSTTTAWWFRAGTIATLAVTVIFGLIYAGGSTAESVDNWHEVVYRIAILSALAGIAAYLGRQASNYHRIATWAQAIEIQLKAFRGFINEIDDEESRQAMFVLFAKRVLESPPDGKASNDEVTNLIQPLVDQASKLRPPT